MACSTKWSASAECRRREPPEVTGARTRPPAAHHEMPRSVSTSSEVREAARTPGQRLSAASNVHPIRHGKSHATPARSYCWRGSGRLPDRNPRCPESTRRIRQDFHGLSRDHPRWQRAASRAGDGVYQDDGLRTGADGHLGVTLKDDTRISLGPQSEMRLSRFQFSPAEGQLALVLRLLRGSAAFVSGRIAGLRPEAVAIETPHTIVGVRGTHLAMRVEGP